MIVHFSTEISKLTAYITSTPPCTTQRFSSVSKERHPQTGTMGGGGGGVILKAGAYYEDQGANI